MMQTKTFKLKIDDAQDEPGVFTGYASTFGNEDVVGDVFDKGSFKRSAKAKGRGLPILLSHNHDTQLGVNLEMEEDDHGLLVKGELMIDDIPKAREVYAIIKRSAELGRAMGLSVGFQVKKEKWNEETRHFKEVELYEYSITPFAANPLASVTHARDGFHTHSTAHELMQLTKRIKDAGYENDPQQLRLIEKSIEQLQALIVNDNGVNKDDDSPDADDSAQGHSELLAEFVSFKESLAGVGNYERNG